MIRPIPTPADENEGGRATRSLAAALLSILASSFSLAPSPSSAWPLPSPGRDDSPTPSASAAPAAGRRQHPREKTLIKRRWGIEPLGVHLSAAGHMLEFRYRVLDTDKAGPLFERRTKPFLVHEASGAKLAVPTGAKVGPLRSSDAPIAGRRYWMFFGNPGRLVKPGEPVTVVIGEFRERFLVQ